MKKFSRMKVALIAAVALACAAAGTAFTGCVKTQSYTGEMHYEQYSVNFGIKVCVEVQSEKKGDRIRKVTVVDSDYVSASPSGWDKETWDNNLQSLLNAYRGMYVKDVLAMEVATSDVGAPYVKGDAGFVSYDDDLIITGATLGSGRLLLAVQDALSKIDG